MQEYIKITVLNNYIKSIFDKNPHLQKVYIKGEISNFKSHTTGHLYFTLKDDNSRINAVMFRGNTHNLSFKPEDGQNVLVIGRISSYPATGAYQIYVEKMDLDGLGNLYIEFEKLKKKLSGEGLFDKEHKLPIPKYPKRIGIVTASTGAAIKDILSTIKRRYPICETILFPTLVQGVSASSDIAKKIEIAQGYELDILIVGRGGGSIEDLWPFNEEIVARAIYNSKIPIISAVGHEVDTTISDFVADLRAPTPTGAAEMAVPMISEVKQTLLNYQTLITSYLNKVLSNSKNSLDKYQGSYILKNPMMLYDVKALNLNDITNRINTATNNIILRKTNAIDLIKRSHVLKNPLLYLNEKKQNIKDNYNLINNIIDNLINKSNHRLSLMINTVTLVNPLAILDKGYSVIKKDDKIIKSAQDLKEKDIIDIILSKGSLQAQIKKIQGE